MKSLYNGKKLGSVIYHERATDFSKVTAHPEFVLKGKTFHDETGQLKTGTAAFSIAGGNSGGTDTSDATATEGDVVAGATFYANGEKKTGTMPSVTANTPTLTIESAGGGSVDIKHTQMFNTYLPAGETKIGTVIDTNFIPSNIKKDVEIFGVKGTYEGNTKQNYCLVRFYNDDRTTLLYEIVVPYGSSAVYAGEAPTSATMEKGIFAGFEPSTDNITQDTNSYAVYEEPPTLETYSWADISAISAAGTAANYFAVGDTKSVALNGTIGTLAVNDTYYVYILGFDHNSDIEGKGITFGTFKLADGTDIALIDSNYRNTTTDGTKYFNLHHWGSSNIGGWAGCDARYDILGSTDVAPSGYGGHANTYGRTGNDPTATCATNPVANTLMAALPADLRAVMKPKTIYSNNKGGGQHQESDVTASVDYLPLLAEYEIYGSRTYANQYEPSKQARYAYYAAGNTALKYLPEKNNNCEWWQRSALYKEYSNYYGSNVFMGSGQARSSYAFAPNSLGLAPIFLV